MAIDLRNLDSTLLHLYAAPAGAEPVDHFVELYERDEQLLTSVQTFISSGLVRGEGGIVVAEREHLDQIDGELSKTFDLTAARLQGTYLSIEANEALALFMRDGMPDAQSFERSIGEMVRRVAGGGRKLRIFGEMVALLMQEGNVAAAIALEDLWNDLAHENDFRLFCAYPSATFADDDLGKLRDVCNRHSHVLVPADSV